MNKNRLILRSLALVVLIIITEYFFRHYVRYWFPRIGASYRVNDMLALFIGYALLLAGIGLVLGTNWQQELATLLRTSRMFMTDWKYVIWLVALTVTIAILPIVDQFLWGSFAFPNFESSYLNPAIWLARWGLFLKVITLVAVNGLFVPVAEEYLWRGYVQVRLKRALNPSLAIVATSLLFSLKHVIVDASMGRFLMIIGFGVITGLLAQRKSWHSAAILHIVVNSLSSVMALVLGLV